MVVGNGAESPFVGGILPGGVAVFGCHLLPLLLLFELLERSHDGVDLPFFASHLALGALVFATDLLGRFASAVVTCCRVDAVLTFGHLGLDVELIGELLLDGHVRSHR